MARIAAMSVSASGGRSDAAQFSATWAGRLPPGIAQDTAPSIKIQLFAFRLVALCVAVVSPALVQSSDQHEINVAKSSAQFSIEHIFVDRVTGTVPILS